MRSAFAEGISCLTNLVSMTKADLLIQLRHLSIMEGKKRVNISDLKDPSKVAVHDGEKGLV